MPNFTNLEGHCGTGSYKHLDSADVPWVGGRGSAGAFLCACACACACAWVCACMCVCVCVCVSSSQDVGSVGHSAVRSEITPLDACRRNKLAIRPRHREPMPAHCRQEGTLHVRMCRRRV